MKSIFRAACAVTLLASTALLPAPMLAQDRQEALPSGLQTGDETPWIYRGSDVPRDKDWLFGELDNGLRYAVRHNGVPPGQVSIRIRIDAGSLHEMDSEQGFAHLMEHLSFRESKYLGPAQAIPTWQRLGATFGSDTNAETSPTHTVYKLDLPGITPASLEESFKLLSGMMREPVLSQANVDTEVPIVLAEKRERGGAGERVELKTRQTLFAGQRLANRLPIGTEETLNAATGKALQAFHDRWYRPENTVIVVAGDTDPMELARLVEKYFGDWKGKGKRVEAPDFGDPVAPAGADPENPLGEMGVVVEPDMPRAFTYAVMRPWRPVNDTIVYNEGLLLDAVSQAIVNRRLRSRARAGGSYLEAQVYQDDVSRSTDATFVTFYPLSEDWQTPLSDVRAIIADAIAQPPTQEEIDREVAEFDIAFVSELEQKSVLAGSKLADQIVQAVDIREAVAAPETVLQVFRGMKGRLNPSEIHERTKMLFDGAVIRSVYVTPDANEATADTLRLALDQDVGADGSARLAAQTISFDDLPPVGEPGTIVSEGSLGLTGLEEIERIELGNGIKAILWPNDAEPGRVTVRVRFGAGYRAFDPKDAPYVALGEMALVGAGLGELGQEELDRITTGRKMGFDFAIEDAAFTFNAQTRSADVSDQLYLFAAKLGMPRWDENPITRAKAAANLAYDAMASSPGAVLNRDLDFLLNDNDPRFATPTPAEMNATTVAGFRRVWEPLLKQGPVEVSVFGEFDRNEVVETLRRTFGALPERTPIPASVAGWVPDFPDTDAPEVLNHRGDPNQAAAVIAWPSGGGIEELRESRQLEILTQLFNNRLMEAMREKAGASYAPQVVSEWPKDLAGGGRILAFAQLKPEDVPVFFAEAERIAVDLANTPADSDELARVTEPLRQLISRASTGNVFWLYQLEGATYDPRRIALLRTLLGDYSRTTPEAMQALAKRYFAAHKPWQLAIIPEGQSLATSTDQSVAAAKLGTATRETTVSGR
ncbi:peptidase M16-like protein [Altererythrobacter epoxidivorans]|uniref:Peptidase M16-like protein n=1 Tax=Altererythrobacter epoxidivorans TaxID=361183 RepID=A0A0M4MHA9_9SPHN|nr:M16 family metallopeptidase [Altererythrobacter epoxidivorans]ALE16893.1 peptidase M16-like protein [Altererythrobacter epoxidivorans]